MDAQHPFASREDIWRIHEEVKELYTTQAEHGDRLTRLERCREDSSRLKSVWGPLSPFPGVVGTTVHPDPSAQPSSSFNPAAEAFKSFDQGGQQHGLVNNLNHLESEEEPRRGASRANSVRFDESAIHGYYGQASRSTSELVPLRTGSGLGSHPLTERSLSHRSDGRQSSSGHSHHSARTNSLGLEASRLLGSTSGSPPNIGTPPAGLYILGPVPCIIRCWLTTNFSNDSLLYAAVCSGSFRSSLGYPLIRELGLENHIVEEDGVRNIKLPIYLPEASMQQSSARAESPVPQLPMLTIQFLVHEVDPNDKPIHIFIGSDVLRAHNADVLFSQDKIMMVDDERNRISIPLVRPENDSAFRTLSTAPSVSHHEYPREKGVTQPQTNGLASPVVTGRSSHDPRRETVASALKLRTSPLPFETRDKPRSAHFEDDLEDTSTEHTQAKSATGSEASFGASAKPAASGVWGSWRRDSGTIGPDSSFQRPTTKNRGMKVLKPNKSLSSSSRPGSNTTTATQGSETSTTTRPVDLVRRTSQPPHVDDPEMFQPSSARSVSRSENTPPSATKSRSANPVGGASAFGWLNPSQQAR